MRKLTTVALILAFAASASAAVLYEQSFEDPNWLGGQYVDPGDALVDHDLLNIVGLAAVDGPGFDASYVNTRCGVGLTDGDYVGVTDYAGTVGTWVDGAQGYQMSDCDGKMVLTFDAVPGATHCSFWMYVQVTGYEADDVITATYGSTVFLDTTGQDINDLLIEGYWVYFGGPIDGAGQLVISLDSNSGSEAIFIDHVLISDDATIANEDMTWGQVKDLF